jgi:hypothetical protein
MAATLAGARLTEAHRLAQTGLGARVSAEMLLLWSLVDPKRLDQTVPAWLEAAMALIQVRRVESAQLAGNYLRVFRTLEAPTAPAFRPLLSPRLNTLATSTSLRVVGPISVKKAMTAGTPLSRASEIAANNTARAAMRHTLEGGRDTITATVQADPAVRGFRRVTSGSACKFCTMLAGRGAVYSASTARFAAHDGCSCSAEPVYERN